MKISFLDRKSALILIFVICVAGSAKAQIIQFRPDLSVTSVDAVGGTYEPGDTISVETRVENIGNLFAYAGYTITFYASVGNTHYSLGSWDYPSISPGQEHYYRSSCTFPEDIPDGDYYIQIVVTCTGDTNTSNNSGYDSSTVAVESPSADLVAYALTVETGDRYRPGDQIGLYIRVINRGPSSSNSFTIDFYVSEDSEITADDYRIGSLDHGGLAPGEEYWDFPSRFSLPDHISQGAYYIGMIVNYEDDADSSNNVYYYSNAVSVGTPAYLSVESVAAADGTYPKGSTIRIDAVIKNTGYLNSGGFTVEFYASTDTAISGSDYRLGSESRDDLPTDEYDRFTATCQFPPDIPDGEYYIGMIVTWWPGEGTSRNTAYDSEPILIGNPVDLAVLQVDAEDGPFTLNGNDRHNPINVTSTVRNAGMKNSDRYTVDFYASSDRIINTDDYHIAFANRDGLAPGREHRLRTLCEFPPNIPEGRYYVGALITYSDDSNPANNAGYDNVRVTIAHPAGYVCGHMEYPDFRAMRYSGQKDVNHPIRYALVSVWDSGARGNDPSDDNELGRTTYTDHNGNYGLAIPTNAPVGRQVYVRVYTKGTIRIHAEGPQDQYAGFDREVCDVRSSDYLSNGVPKLGTSELYNGQSAASEHPRNSSVEVNLTVPDSEGSNRGAFNVFDSVVEGFIKAREFFDVNLPHIVTYWPGPNENSYYRNGGAIFFEQEDRGDRDTIMHEYGHYIAHEYDFAQGFGGDDPNHWWGRDLRYSADNDATRIRNEQEAMNLAFREAWPYLFSIATQYGDTDYPCSGDPNINDFDEGAGSMSIDYDLQEDTSYHASVTMGTGQYYENMVCYALWDIFDDNDDDGDDDDTLSDTSLSKIWAISLDDKPGEPYDIRAFWNGWFARGYGRETEITRIFRRHKMSFTKP